MKNYKKTLRACYLGLITQAIAANFAPLLFLTFHSDFNISLGQIALIPAVFYVTQLSVDLICAKYGFSAVCRSGVDRTCGFAQYNISICRNTDRSVFLCTRKWSC